MGLSLSLWATSDEFFVIIILPILPCSIRTRIVFAIVRMEPMMLMSQTQLARRLEVSRRTLERWRVEGGGPPFLKVGRGVRYDDNDLAAWIAAQRRLSTSDPGPRGA